MTQTHPTATFYHDDDQHTRETLAAMSARRRDALRALNAAHAAQIPTLVDGPEANAAVRGPLSDRDLLGIFVLTHDTARQAQEDEALIGYDHNRFTEWLAHVTTVADALRGALTNGLREALHLEFAPYIGETTVAVRIAVAARHLSHPPLTGTLTTPAYGQTLYLQQIDAPYALEVDGRDEYTTIPAIVCKPDGFEVDAQRIVDDVARLITWAQDRIATFHQPPTVTTPSPALPFHAITISQVLSTRQRVICTPAAFGGDAGADATLIGELTDVDWANGLLALDDGHALHVLPLRAYVVTRLDDPPTAP